MDNKKREQQKKEAWIKNVQKVYGYDLKKAEELYDKINKKNNEENL